MQGYDNYFESNRNVTPVSYLCSKMAPMVVMFRDNAEFFFKKQVPLFCYGVIQITLANLITKFDSKTHTKTQKEKEREMLKFHRRD